MTDDANTIELPAGEVIEVSTDGSVIGYAIHFVNESWDAYGFDLDRHALHKLIRLVKRDTAVQYISEHWQKQIASRDQ